MRPVGSAKPYELGNPKVLREAGHALVGRTHENMPAWGHRLDGAEITALAEYVLAFGERQARARGRGRPPGPLHRGALGGWERPALRTARCAS